MNACPCTIADEPCMNGCTCVSPHRSNGCLCCAKYGSDEQRKDKANWIVKSLKEESDIIIMYNALKELYNSYNIKYCGCNNCVDCDAYSAIEKFEEKYGI